MCAVRRCVLPALLACAIDAFAAHPLITEDTGTQGGDVVRIGAIHTVRQGCDVDFGYQARLNDSAPPRVLLAGLTVRW
jgi:hypothetical protein